MSKWILGVGGSDHDFSAALMRDHDIRVAVEQERLSRRKHGVCLWYESPVRQAIDYCLTAEGIRITDVEAIVSSDTLPTRLRQAIGSSNLRQFNHHLCHAASAYMMHPPTIKAGVLVYDGFGSSFGSVAGDPLRLLRETFSFFLFTPTSYECMGRTLGLAYVEPDDFPMTVTNSIGMLYEMVTGSLGYNLLESGKTMGLAAYGTPRYLDLLEKFVTYGDTLSDCFGCSADSAHLALALEQIMLSADGFTVKADLAASVQALVNKTLVHCEQFFRGLAIERLSISGGCALNTVANTFLVEHSTINVPIDIPPHCGDSGLAFGALWLEAFTRLGKAPQLTFRGRCICPHIARPGRSYSVDERRTAAQEFYPRLVLDCSVRSPSDIAPLLVQGMVVGVLNGGSEIGPRALGGRSIIASPVSVATRERINRLLKQREPFRPLAPVVLQSHFDDYFFDDRCADAFMLKVARVRERCMRDAPAVVHIDGTARVQVVAEDGDPFLVNLLTAFYGLTGIAVLINTSFNRQGEPIVESPSDAIDAFLGMGLDGLYLDGDFYRRSD